MLNLYNRHMSYIVKTPNYKFVLNVTETMAPVHAKKYIVGDTKTPCLEASVYMPDIDPSLLKFISNASLYKIDALERCALEEPESGNHSFGTELLFAFINIVKANHPYVKTITLSDSSYIPCNRSSHDTLDLLTYSIALYGKTWYESKVGAYLESPKDQERYDREIKEYMSEETKSQTNFEELWKSIMKNDFAVQTMYPEFSRYKDMYDSSKTFSAFFISLNTHIPEDQKCRFYKDWLEGFIDSRIVIKRNWKFNIDDNLILGNVLNVSQKIPMPYRKSKRSTRKRKL